jgi:hypothetical protein
MAYCQKSKRDNELMITMRNRVLENLLFIYFVPAERIAFVESAISVGSGEYYVT